MLLAECALSRHYDFHDWSSRRLDVMAHRRGPSTRTCEVYCTQTWMARSSRPCRRNRGLARFKNDAADGGRGCRHMIEAVDFLHPVPQRTAHRQPHHHLDRLVAGVAQVFERWQVHEPLGVAREVVEEIGVELLVDEARARTLDLV